MWVSGFLGSRKLCNFSSSVTWLLPYWALSFLHVLKKKFFTALANHYYST